MNARAALLRWLRRDPVLAIALALAGISLFFVPFSWQALIQCMDWKVLSILACLMLVVAALREEAVLQATASAILNRVHTTRGLRLCMCALVFFSSMLMTNDVALLTFVPLTLTLYALSGHPEEALLTVILQTLCANIGSSLTPVGNPQNLYLYTRYQPGLGAFLAAVAPLVAVGGLLCLGRVMFSRPQRLAVQMPPVALCHPWAIVLDAGLFLLSLCAVFGYIPYGLCLIVVAAALLLTRPKLFRQIDWGLLLTFAGFFVFIGNVSRLAVVPDLMARWLDSPASVLWAGALSSQVFSNVPAALLLSGFTEAWKPLCLGVNAGGCGTLIASLASVISYKLYAAQHPGEGGRYLMLFTGYNGLFLLVLTALGLFLI